MSSSNSETVDLRRYATFAWRWLWFIVLLAASAGGSALVLSQRSTPVYEASATLLVSPGDKTTGLEYSGILMSERLAKSYSQLLKEKLVLQEAGARLGTVIEGGAISVEPVRDTQLIRIKVRHTNPTLAASIANMIPQVFIEQNTRIQSERYSDSMADLEQEMQRLDTEAMAMQRKLDAERAKTLPDNAEVARLENLLLEYRSTYANLLERHEEIRLAAARGVDTLTIFGQAEVPTQPTLPRTRNNTLLAAVLGAIVAIAIVLLVEYLDDTIKNPRDVERIAQLPTLATILRFSRREAGSRGLLLAAGPDSPAAEAYRLLRTNLQFSTLGMARSAVTLLVTSTAPNEGKTTTVANLGVGLAQIGKKVLLVDTDLRCPALHTRFQLTNDKGLTSLLLERDTDPRHAIQSTDIPGLAVLASGAIPPNPTEVLESPQTAALLGQLRLLADYVLLDSPPVLGTADASILAQKADGVLLVTETGAIRAEVFKNAISVLAGVKAQLLGVVLNKASKRHGDHYHRYHRRGQRNYSARSREARKQVSPQATASPGMQTGAKEAKTPTRGNTPSGQDARARMSE